MNEFSLINKYFTWKNNDSSIIKAVGDDCAILQNNNKLVTSIDTLIAGVHFFINTDSSKIAHKALAVNLSDIAAMGAVPKYFTLALSLPKINHIWLQKFSDSLKIQANKYKLSLIGGNLAKGDLSITISIIGEAKNPIMRSGAKIDDGIFVSNNLGGAAFALEMINNKQQISNNLLEKLDTPIPQINLGLQLVNIANSCIDISDGLLQDLNHILVASHVGADIYANKIPLFKSASINNALNGGGDYELCFTAPINKIKKIKNITQIGFISKQLGLRLDSKNVKIDSYQHFK